MSLTIEIIANLKKVAAIAAQLLGQENGQVFLGVMQSDGAEFLLGDPLEGSNFFKRHIVSVVPKQPAKLSCYRMDERKVTRYLRSLWSHVDMGPWGLSDYPFFKSALFLNDFSSSSRSVLEKCSMSKSFNLGDIVEKLLDPSRKVLFKGPYVSMGKRELNVILIEILLRRCGITDSETYFENETSVTVSDGIVSEKSENRIRSEIVIDGGGVECVMETEMDYHGEWDSEFTTSQHEGGV